MATKKASGAEKSLTAKQKSLLSRRAEVIEKMHKARADYFLTRAELARFQQEMLEAGLSASFIHISCW